jgi:6-phosphogluconolactonase
MGRLRLRGGGRWPDVDCGGQSPPAASAAIVEVHSGERDELLLRLASDFTTEAAAAIARRGFFAIALPGGSVAANCFPTLAARSLNWRQVQFFWVDERAVAPSDPESNYALARELWLAPTGVPDASIHRMPADDPNLDAAAAAYSNDLTGILGPSARLDFVLLGVGPDGHVASLFPRHEALAFDDRLVAAVLDATKPPPRRLTLTLPVLAGAERLVVVAFGEEKAAALREAVDRDDSPQPLATVLRRTRRPLVLADRAAASLITPRS